MLRVRCVQDGGSVVYRMGAFCLDAAVDTTKQYAPCIQTGACMVACRHAHGPSGEFARKVVACPHVRGAGYRCASAPTANGCMACMLDTDTGILRCTACAGCVQVWPEAFGQPSIPDPVVGAAHRDIGLWCTHHSNCPGFSACHGSTHPALKNHPVQEEVSAECLGSELAEPGLFALAV
jgi:hypothetical protein